MDKLSVEVDHSKESLERRTFYWMRKLRDGGAVLLESVEPEANTCWQRNSTWLTAKTHLSRLMVRP